MLLEAVRDKNVMQLKKLNAVLFPVRYNDKYYADALASGEFTKLGHLSLFFLALSLILDSLFFMLFFVVPHLSQLLSLRESWS